MPRLPRLIGRRIPLLLAAEVAVAAKRHWDDLTPGERQQMTALVRRSRGRRGNLTDREWQELKRLIGKLDLVGLGRELAPLGRGARRRR